MSKPESQVVKKHKEESASRIKSDQADQNSIREYFARIIDRLDPEYHAGGQLLNIVSGEVAMESVNPHEAVQKGNHIIKEFKDSWPSGFYKKLSKAVTTMDSKKKFLVIGGKQVYDHELIYA